MKSLKKITALALATLTLSGSLTSCATVFGGRITEHQKRKPLPGEIQREVRVGALIADVLLFWPGAVIDFATGAIYKPQRNVAVQTKPTAANSVKSRQ
ncbi:hypothetical protein [Spirosoma foliorum]|uniref:YceK/YidQ family lipoprotein n=1 Tax=Spirosoma foliorum TaxID=2710596 RepID=A0A7G5H195_9BACT|nr:hypothetical protein [Spirosoma foliorum]QMW04887.1 hypothetical protein H3H32_08255 [Spirosoma foliorum]